MGLKIGEMIDAYKKTNDIKPLRTTLESVSRTMTAMSRFAAMMTHRSSSSPNRPAAVFRLQTPVFDGAKELDVDVMP